MPPIVDVECQRQQIIAKHFVIGALQARYRLTCSDLNNLRTNSSGSQSMLRGQGSLCICCGADVARDKPQTWVGRKCKIFWPDDDEWYDAAVRAYDDRIGRHNVWYFYDETVSKPCQATQPLFMSTL